MKREDFWNVNNVTSYKNVDVVNGQVDMSEGEYQDILDDIYGTVQIAGMSYSVGRALLEVDPVAFRCGLGDEESRLQAELEEQLEREDSDDIEFDEGDEFDLEDDEEE
jgi:hypothetical protein